MNESDERGWALADSEQVPDAYGVAVPFFTDGTVAGSVDATIPRYRLTDVDVTAVAESLAHSATELNRLLSVPRAEKRKTGRR